MANGSSSGEPRSAGKDNAARCNNGIASIFRMTMFVGLLVMVVYLYAENAHLRKEVSNDETTTSYKEQHHSSGTAISTIGSGEEDAPIIDTATDTTKVAKPMFIMHVGPPKTATTTLQMALTQYKDILGRQDNFVYVGKLLTGARSRHGSPREKGSSPVRMTLLSRDCHKTMNKAPPGTEPKCWGRFINELNRLYDRGVNVIVSEERFSTMHVDTPEQANMHGGTMARLNLAYLRDALVDWDVRVVIGYRRYAEWIPSAYYEMDRGATYKKSKWPDMGGKKLLSLFDQILVWLQSTETMHFPYTDQVVAAYGEYFPVELLNLHDELDVATQLACNILPDAHAACDAALSETDDSKTANPSKSLFYDLLVVAAYEQGMIRQKLRRSEVEKAAKKRQEVELGFSPWDFPLDCPSDEDLKPLLEKSLALEKQLLPDYFNSPEGEAAHREHFWKNVAEHKFCSIDVDAVLQDPEWIAFFQELK